MLWHVVGKKLYYMSLLNEILSDVVKSQLYKKKDHIGLRVQ